MEKNQEEISKFDKLILSDDIKIKKEGILEGQGNPVSINEILELLKMKESICKISYEKVIDNEIQKGKGTGFFCEIDNNPIKYALFTNNHVLNESNIQIGNTIYFECLDYEQSFFNPSYIQKEIKITNERKVFTNKELDYTCIELFKSDKILDYFKIDPQI